MNSKDKLKCRKVKAVLRYYVPNCHKYPEKYAHHLLFMFYPFRNEDDLKSANLGTYNEKLHEPGILEVVNRNKLIFEPYGDLVDTALLNIRADLLHNSDAYSHQENDQVEALLNVQVESDCDEDPTNDAVILGDTVPNNTPSVIPDNELNEKIRSLNSKQRQYFEIIFNWAKSYVKNLSSITQFEIEPLHIFITGGAGTGKSHLIRTIFHSLTKTFSYRSMAFGKAKVLLLAPTGVAAINIDGTTIHSALGIPVGHFGKNLPKLNDKKRTALRNNLCETRVLIIDEISMVSNLQLLYVHLRLIEIFGCSDNIPFAGLSIIVVGDFYQLPPVQQRTVYADYKDTWQNLAHLWKLFKIAELDEVMRQRGDAQLIDLLNKVRTASLDEQDEALIKSRFIKKGDANYPADELHIFAENSPCDTHNSDMLNANPNPLHTAVAIDQLPKNVSKDLIDKALQRNQSQTGGLAHTLHLKINARVMLTVNIDIPDRLTNGQIGIVKHILRSSNNISKVYVKFDDNTAGLRKLNSDNLAQQNMWIPIEKAEGTIAIRVNKNSSPVIKRTQIPLMLSWACTVHKVQGLSLNKAIISFTLFNQRNFNNGQMYVALSRVTSLEGMFLTGEFKSSAIKSDIRATQEYERMRNECTLEPLRFANEPSDDTLSITLLNTRSLNRHAVDIASDKDLLNTDLLCLTETQLMPDQNNAHINETLHQFDIIHNKCIDKFQSLSICLKPDVDIIQYTHTTGISVIEFKKCSFLPTSFKIILLYRKNNTCLSSFYDAIRNVMHTDKIHIVLGDFNINAQDENSIGALSNLFSDFVQIVKNPTHLAGGTLDHVYVDKDIANRLNVTNFIKCIYFSDHDAIQLVLCHQNI